MRYKPAVAAAVITAAWAAWCQPAAPLVFEVASVKVAARAPAQWRPNRPGADRIDFQYATLWYCLTYAYGVRSYQLFGPAWLKDARYDIVAKGPAGTRRDQLPEMMRNLLAERFKLQMHHETREIAGLVLVVGKDGPKLKESPAESGDGQGGAAIGMSATPEGVEQMDVKGAPMSTLATTLSALLGRPVVDQTGLPGRYDFTLEFSRDETAGTRSTGGYGEPPAMPPPVPGGQPGLSIYSSIQQLGLRLEARKLPLDVVVIDRVEPTPTEN